ncbi:hypothetical protein EDB83DRAFT_2310423 [Lactarius deliciosus]|nr:hypothetical protein EDB83DRAFT_2310423 [Lactarius deliciosus]
MAIVPSSPLLLLLSHSDCSRALPCCRSESCRKAVVAVKVPQALHLGLALVWRWWVGVVGCQAYAVQAEFAIDLGTPDAGDINSDEATRATRTTWRTATKWPPPPPLPPPGPCHRQQQDDVDTDNDNNDLDKDDSDNDGDTTKTQAETCRRRQRNSTMQARQRALRRLRNGTTTGDNRLVKVGLRCSCCQIRKKLDPTGLSNSNFASPEPNVPTHQRHTNASPKCNACGTLTATTALRQDSERQRGSARLQSERLNNDDDGDDGTIAIFNDDDHDDEAMTTTDTTMTDGGGDATTAGGDGDAAAGFIVILQYANSPTASTHTQYPYPWWLGLACCVEAVWRVGGVLHVVLRWRGGSAGSCGSVAGQDGGGTCARVACNLQGLACCVGMARWVGGGRVLRQDGGGSHARMACNVQARRVGGGGMLQAMSGRHGWGGDKW